MPWDYECPACGGKGCKLCDHGVQHLNRCPLDEVPGVYFEAFELADLYEKGLPPVDGGTLDQASAFLAACRVIWAERARLEKQELQRWQRNM